MASLLIGLSASSFHVRARQVESHVNDMTADLIKNNIAAGGAKHLIMDTRWNTIGSRSVQSTTTAIRADDHKVVVLIFGENLFEYRL